MNPLEAAAEALEDVLSYAEAVQQTVDELRELLTEMEGFEDEPKVGKRRWWWPWQTE